MQKLADREQIPGTQEAPLQAAPQMVDEVTQQAAGVLNVVAMDEQPGEDLAMGQPGVVVPQEGVVVRYEGDVSNATGVVEAVVDATDQGQAMYVKRDSTGLDTVMVAQQGPGVVGQAVYIDSMTPMGMEGYIVAGQVG